MDIDIDSLQVHDNEKESRYELAVGDDVAVAEYERRPDCVVFTHTQVPPPLSGKGLASKLVRHALDDTRARGLRVIALCEYVAAYINRHPEYKDLLKSGV
jgi:predicted GNAT family acetyltransferase